MGHIETTPPAPAPVPYKDMADAELISLVAETDRQAFVELFGRYAGRVKAFLMRWGMPADQAEEAAQEVMVSIWRRAAQFDPAKAGATTWIFAIARNRRIDMIRRATRPEPDPNDPLFVPDPEPGGMEVLSAQEREGAVRAGIAELPEAQQEILRLSFYEGLSHGECAERLGVPLGTVKSRIRLAFSKLRDILGDDIAEELKDD
ncbi:MAG: sigma-70 family RNA polymerase sigma factor [Pseudomonadota bacterium]